MKSQISHKGYNEKCGGQHVAVAVNWQDAKVFVFSTPQAATAYLQRQRLVPCGKHLWATRKSAIEDGNYWSITETTIR